MSVFNSIKLSGYKCQILENSTPPDSSCQSFNYNSNQQKVPEQLQNLKYSEESRNSMINIKSKSVQSNSRKPLNLFNQQLNENQDNNLDQKRESQSQKVCINLFSLDNSGSKFQNRKPLNIFNQNSSSNNQQLQTSKYQQNSTLSRANLNSSVGSSSEQMLKQFNMQQKQFRIQKQNEISQLKMQEEKNFDFTDFSKKLENIKNLNNEKGTKNDTKNNGNFDVFGEQVQEQQQYNNLNIKTKKRTREEFEVSYEQSQNKLKINSSQIQQNDLDLEQKERQIQYEKESQILLQNWQESVWEQKKRDFQKGKKISSNTNNNSSIKLQQQSWKFKNNSSLSQQINIPNSQKILEKALKENKEENILKITQTQSEIIQENSNDVGGYQKESNDIKKQKQENQSEKIDSKSSSILISLQNNSKEGGELQYQEFQCYDDKLMGVSTYHQGFVEEHEVDDDCETDEETTDYYVKKCEKQLIQAITSIQNQRKKAQIKLLRKSSNRSHSPVYSRIGSQETVQLYLSIDKKVKSAKKYEKKSQRLSEQIATLRKSRVFALDIV